MLTAKSKFKDADEYIAMFSPDVQELLRQLRTTIKNTAKGAEEVISYQMPAFKLNGMLVWYAAYKEHIGFYPTGSPIKAFKTQLVGYKTSKGAIQFPLEKKLPLKLIKDIVKFRVEENSKRAENKLKKKRGDSK